MNDDELRKEMERNASDKEIARMELETAREKWVEYIMGKKSEICSSPHPAVVRLKRKAKLRKFAERIKSLFGFNSNKPKNGWN